MKLKSVVMVIVGLCMVVSCYGLEVKSENDTLANEEAWAKLDKDAVEQLLNYFETYDASIDLDLTSESLNERGQK